MLRTSFIRGGKVLWWTARVSSLRGSLTTDHKYFPTKLLWVHFLYDPAFYGKVFQRHNIPQTNTLCQSFLLSYAFATQCVPGCRFTLKFRKLYTSLMCVLYHTYVVRSLELRSTLKYIQCMYQQRPNNRTLLLLFINGSQAQRVRLLDFSPKKGTIYFSEHNHRKICIS